MTVQLVSLNFCKKSKESSKRSASDNIDPPAKRSASENIDTTGEKSTNEVMDPPPKKRGRGRPRKDCQTNSTKEKTLDEDNINPPKKRGPGRPRKETQPRNESQTDNPTEPRNKSQVYDLDESRAPLCSWTINDPDLCKLCNFSFDYPFKNKRELTRCFHCSLLLHLPCLRRYGPCPCQL